MSTVTVSDASFAETVLTSTTPVLVDFWATWCGPCIAELPNVLAAYEKYHDQGFEVVGISLDEDRDALEKFVQSEEIPWPILHDKAARAGKLVVEVPAAYSSQECARCGHIHPDNRPRQARFVCQACGHHAHADHNAAQVIAARGARWVADGHVVEKPKKRCALKRTTVGPGEAEPAGLIPRTPVENALRRGRGNTSARRSMKQETPATSQRL